MATIKECLEEYRRRAEEGASLGYVIPELACTGRQLVEMYRLGILCPGDESVRVVIPGADAALVEEFLATFKGPE